jgi:hypothetical protein
MADTTTVTVALGALAGAITLIGALITRGNLVSGFRQSWINDQRNDLAIIASKATIISSNLVYDKARDLEAFAQAMSRIRLRDNPDSPEWSYVIPEIEKLHHDLWVNLSRAHDVSTRLRDIDRLSQRPLKDNWKVTSRGELIHVIALVAVGILIVTIVLYAAFVSFNDSEKIDDSKLQSSCTQRAVLSPVAPIGTNVYIENHIESGVSADRLRQPDVTVHSTPRDRAHRPKVSPACKATVKP